MQAIIDHIAAVVIGAAILFILAALSIRSQDSSIEAAQVDIGKTELRSLVDLIEQDFYGMGSGMTYPNMSNLARVVQTFGPGSGSNAGYDVLSFYALESDTAADTALVTYRWRQQGTVTLPNGSTANTYEVERIDASGGTAGYYNVTGFSLSLMDKEFLDIPPGSANLENARYLTVDLAMVSPVGVEGLLEQTRWKKQFRPLNLNPEGRQVVQASCVPTC